MRRTATQGVNLKNDPNPVAVEDKGYAIIGA
jgi:hypothetical protein